MRHSIHSRSVAALLVALAAACEPATDRLRDAASFRITDDAGRIVALAAPARRVVSLLPSFTELVYALGAGDRLVGRTAWCDYPRAAAAVADVGDGLTPNVEAVAARRPDLVLLYRTVETEAAAAQLRRLGIPAALFRVDRLADLARAARGVGTLLDRAAAGDSIADHLERLAAEPGPRPVARIAFVVWDNPPIVIGRESFLHELARLSGGANVFGDVAAPSAQVGLETIAARDPDLLIQLGEGPRPPDYATRREWQTVAAVRERRFVYLTESLFGRPTPRATEAVRQFRRRLEAAR